MPMLGVMRETLEREGGSMSGEEDFFSVARTMPFVAEEEVSRLRGKYGCMGSTFDTQRSHALVYGVQRIFYGSVSQVHDSLSKACSESLPI